MSRHTMEERNIAYRLLAENYLVNKYEVDILDQRFSEYSPAFIPSPQRTEEQNASQLKYISLLNSAHTERLNEKDEAILDSIIDGTTSTGEAIEFIERTYLDILAGSTEQVSYVEYFRDIHGRGRFPSKAIVFIFSDIPEYDEEGNRDIDREEHKNNVFYNVKTQFEALVNREGEPQVFLVRY